MADITIPAASKAIINQKDGPQGNAGTATREFYNFLRQLASITTDADIQAEIEAILIRLDEIEVGSNFTIQGPYSVAVVGQPSTGLVALSLRNDIATPGASYYYGTDASGVKGWFPLPAPRRGITVTGGSIGGTALPVGQTFGGLAASDYVLTGNWYLWCSPTGSIEVDVQRTTFGSLPPGSGDSICGGNEPAVAAGISASGNFSGWDPNITRDDAVTVEVNSVTSVTWFVLLLEAV